MNRSHGTGLAVWLVTAAFAGAQTPDPQATPDVPQPPQPPGATPSEEGELEANPEMGRRTLTPDPLRLPGWLPGDLREWAHGRPVNLGGGLWPPELFPLQPVPPLPAHETQAGLRPAGWVLDPQRLISPAKTHEWQRFLERHSQESKHPVRLLVADPRQELPADHADDAPWRSWFEGHGDEVLAVVFPGEPERTRIVFGPAMRQHYPAAALAAVSRDSMGKTWGGGASRNSHDELLLQLSIRLIELEKMPSPVPPLIAALPASSPVAAVGTPATPWLDFRWWFAPLAVALVPVAVGAWLWHRRRSRRQTCPLPDGEIVMRLGAPHSGGSGVVVSWE